MIKIMIIITGLFIANLSFAVDYACKVEVNQERGFDTAFKVNVDSVAVDGKVYLQLQDAKAPLGVVSSVLELHRNVSEELAAFNQTLANIADEDISGVPYENLRYVAKIVLIHVETEQDGAIIYRLLDAKSNQLGGTFFMSGFATSCLSL